MNRRRLLRGAASLPVLATLSAWLPWARRALALPASRVRPGQPGWPSEGQWQALGRSLRGRLIAVRSPIAACATDPGAVACRELFANVRNPYYLGDEPGLTQSLGWVDAWSSQPSVHAVAAESAADVAAAVAFARRHDLRLVVKGGGHSYQGTSCAPDSLLVWTRRMDAVTLHDAFVGEGCEGTRAPQPAVSIGAGAIWGRVYDAVATRGGRYVQGGGCLTVGVAGLILSGGFGSFSKGFGMAAASLLEAEIVTSDGEVRVVNACREPELFWALKGGGGGSLGVVTRVTLRTHDLPDFVGGAILTVKAASDEAYRRLVRRIVDLYADALFNPHWGEQIRFRPDNTLVVSMVFQGLDQARAEAAWRPFLDWLSEHPANYALDGEPWFPAVAARRFWDPEFLGSLPGVVKSDDRPDAPAGNVFWSGNEEEAGQVLHVYQSAWLPADLLQPGRRGELAEALFAGSRHWGVSLHFNKGLAGAPAEAIEAARDTATNPAVLDAFALAISGAEGPPAHPAIPGHAPDAVAARRHAGAVGRAMAPLKRLAPAVGSYVSESDFFEAEWQEAFWGANYPRLLAAKDRYDPGGLFTVHHGVGSERWSADGFTRL